MPFLSTDALKPPAGLVEQCYALGNGPWSPVLVDAVTDGQQVSIRTASNTFGTFQFGGNLYKVVVGQQVKITLVCKSVDGGLTWTRLAAATAPAFSRGTAHFDGIQTVIVGYKNSNVASTLVPMQFQNFDLATETWGPVYGAAGAPATDFVKTIWKRPDGTLLVLYANRVAFNPGDPSGLAYGVYDPGLGAWTLIGQDAGANITLLPGWNSTQTLVVTNAISSYMDAAGNVGVFFTTGSLQVVPVIWGNRCFYQQIKADNSLGSFFDFPGQVAPLTGGKQNLEAFTGTPLGVPAIVGDIIVLPTLQTNRNGPFPRQIAVVYLGTPVANPVWSTDNTKSIDPDCFIDDLLYAEEVATVVFDGTTIFAAFVAMDADFTNRARIRYCQTANLLSPADGWSGQTAFDIQIAPPGFNFAGQALSGPSLGSGAGAAGPTITCGNPPNGAVGAPYTHTFPVAGGTAPFTYAITAGALPPGLFLNPATGTVSGIPTLPAVSSFTIEVTDSLAITDAVACSITVPGVGGAGGGGHIVGGLPSGGRIGGCRRRNEFDWCMFREKLRYEKITFPPLCAIPKQFRNWLPWDEDFGANAIPPGAAPLNKIGGIVTPLPAAGDQVVLQTRVPFGYDGLLAGIFHFYTGNGFAQGSGDILWRVQVNQRYLENLGNIEFTLGSPQSPCPLTEGQILLSGQVLRYIVNVPNLSGLIQVGQSQIACGLVGFFWPR